MAWSQAETEFQQLVCTDASIWGLNNATYSSRVDQMSSGLTLLPFLSDSDIRTANYWLIGDENAGIHYLYNNSGAVLQFYYNNSHINWVCASKSYMDNYSGNTIMIGLGSDGTNYKAIVGCKFNLYSRDYVELHVYTGGITSQTVEWVFQNPPISYNWQAVPSIVGKSAVSLDLSVILDINNGEAVTTSDASKFDLNNDSNVITLVNNVINQNE